MLSLLSRKPLRFIQGVIAVIFLTCSGAFFAHAQSQPDVVVFTNGDQLSGKFVRAVGDTVVFHSDVLGDVNIGWDKIKELRTAQKVAVLEKGVKIKDQHLPPNFPIGTASVENQQITIQSANATIPAIPVKNAQVMVDEATFDKQFRGHPGFLQGWNGGATAGATIVSATQNQYTFSGALNLIRVVPTVSWLDPRNRTTFNYAQSYGKITQPSYRAADGTIVPSSFTKSSILHADAERDEYFSPRVYALGMVAFDHNYSQSLDLQQIYGGGLGWTAIKDTKQQLDLKATAQYERQSFSNTPVKAELNLIGSTFGANYLRKFPVGMVFTQQLLYIPAWNELRAYSITETNMLNFPTYKNLSFTMGTVDSYLNNVPTTLPPTKHNSFQFITGITYNIKSSY